METFKLIDLTRDAENVNEDALEQLLPYLNKSTSPNPDVELLRLTTGFQNERISVIELITDIVTSNVLGSHVQTQLHVGECGSGIVLQDIGGNNITVTQDELGDIDIYIHEIFVHKQE